MKNRTFAFVKKLLFSVLFGSAILFLFSSCDSGFKDSLKEDFTSLYVYFAYSPDEEVDGGNVEIADDAFEGLPEDAVLSVPKLCGSYYKQMTACKKFKEIKEAMSK